MKTIAEYLFLLEQNNERLRDLRNLVKAGTVTAQRIAEDLEVVSNVNNSYYKSIAKQMDDHVILPTITSEYAESEKAVVHGLLDDAIFLLKDAEAAIIKLRPMGRWYDGHTVPDAFYKANDRHQMLERMVQDVRIHFTTINSYLMRKD